MFGGKGNIKLCEDILREVAERHNIDVIELSVMSDHISISLTPVNDERLESTRIAKGSIFL